MTYLDVMVTLVFAMVLFWFCYETIYLRLFYKPDINKTLAKQYKVGADYFDYSQQMQASFKKGDFADVLNCAEQVLKDMPYDNTAVLYKAYALYYLNRLPEAKEAFALLETLPGINVSKMIEQVQGGC